MDTEGEDLLGLLVWRDAVTKARGLVVGIVATEAGEVLSETALRDLGGEFYDLFTSDERNVLMEGLLESERYRRGGVGLVDLMREMEEQEWTDRVRSEQRAGRGLEIQRMLIVSGLQGWGFPGEANLVWDDHGRRIETVARGVREIVGAYLLQLVGSAMLDAFICSVCGRPYQFDSDSGQRRPRAGTRRFCDPQCRAEGKRSANLASWHRNKDKWRTHNSR